jgi:hypothetical protein
LLPQPLNDDVPFYQPWLTLASHGPLNLTVRDIQHVSSGSFGAVDFGSESTHRWDALTRGLRSDPHARRPLRFCFERIVFGIDNRCNSKLNRFWPFDLRACWTRFIAAVTSHIAPPLQPRPLQDRLPVAASEVRAVLLEKHGHRLLLNIAELADHVRTHRAAQIDIVDPTSATIVTIVRTMQRAVVVAGMYGSGHLNAIFMPAGSVAIALLPYAEDMTKMVDWAWSLEQTHALQLCGIHTMFWVNRNRARALGGSEQLDPFSADTLVPVRAWAGLYDHAVGMAMRGEVASVDAHMNAALHVTTPHDLE